MMPALFVLDVPEFAPLVAAAKKKSELQIMGPKAGYYRITADDQLRIHRSETGLPEALWFGAFTAGYDGEELVIDSTQFWIGQSKAAAK